MNKFAIRIEGLSKRYELGLNKKRQDTLRDSISAGFKNTFLRKNKPQENFIWALKDISFNVIPGEAIGIIGRNGAGKSTLLKILSQITEPTTGKAIINGRIGSLLEVGTGFHWELTGRENIYLNGALLGMTRKEIVKKFDEIVNFADIEKFLETPVKRYSSGMFVRLGFAVAAYLEPDILVVDEVLAVGDSEFQKRCLGKMDDVTTEGRTVLFVSHNMNIIQRLCKQTIFLDKGKMVAFGRTDEITNLYTESVNGLEKPNSWIDVTKKTPHSTSQVYFSQFLYRCNANPINFYPFPDGPLEIGLRIFSDKNRTMGSIAVSFYDNYGAKLINADTLKLGQSVNLHEGINEIYILIHQLHLTPGIFTVSLWIANPPNQIFEHNNRALMIEVIGRDQEDFTHRPITDGSVTCQFSVINN